MTVFLLICVSYTLWMFFSLASFSFSAGCQAGFCWIATVLLLCKPTIYVYIYIVGLNGLRNASYRTKICLTFCTWMQFRSSLLIICLMFYANHVFLSLICSCLCSALKTNLLLIIYLTKIWYLFRCLNTRIYSLQKFSCFVIFCFCTRQLLGAKVQLLDTRFY